MNPWIYVLLITWSIEAMFLSVLPMLDDPFHKEEKVCFWTWLYRECYELLYGEQ